MINPQHKNTNIKIKKVSTLYINRFNHLHRATLVRKDGFLITDKEVRLCDKILLKYIAGKSTRKYKEYTITTRQQNEFQHLPNTWKLQKLLGDKLIQNYQLN